MARHWTAQYEWFAHIRYVETVGLDPAIAEAIRNRQTPEIADPAEQAAYDLATELNRKRAASDETYARPAQRKSPEASGRSRSACRPRA